MLAHSVLWCELPHDLEFLASVYGKHEKLKHLSQSDPWLYNAGDVAETINVWDGVRNEMARDHEVRRVYEYNLLPLVPIILESEKRGILVDRPRVREYQQDLESRLWDLEACAQAYCGYPINLGSSDQLVRWLRDVEGIPCKSVRDEEITKLQQQYPENPLIEARIEYAAAKQIESHYIRPFLASERVHAEFHPWAQNTGRWSTVKPPLAQLPPDMRKLLVPDPGWPWIEFDWDQQELRILATLAQDQPLLEAFEKEWDPHTLTACELFDLLYPILRTKGEINDAPENGEWRQLVGWTGESDPRRGFAKTFIYKRIYGGSAETDIPGAIKLGLDRAGLSQAGRRWDRAHPAVARFWKRTEAKVRQEREVRSPLGRRWKLMGHDLKRITRQAYDFPMQSTSAVIMNKTLIDIKKRWGNDCYMVYTMHDSIKMAFREEKFDEAWDLLPEIVEQEWNLGGVKVKFPATYEERWCE